jgi:hypothetical protein
MLIVDNRRDSTYFSALSAKIFASSVSKVVE